MQRANQDLNRLRQPNVLPFSASGRWYSGNLGSIGCTQRGRDFIRLPSTLGPHMMDKKEGAKPVEILSVA